MKTTNAADISAACYSDSEMRRASRVMAAYENGDDDAFEAPAPREDLVNTTDDPDREHRRLYWARQ